MNDYNLPHKGRSRERFEFQDATALRSLLLLDQPFIKLEDLLLLMSAYGVPVIHLKVFPLVAKHMSAMAVNANKRHAILLAKDASYPAQIAFYLAHEIGHIALGHVNDSSALVDVEDFSSENQNDDPDEIAADAFALELLTGDPNFTIIKEGEGKSTSNLASKAFAISEQYSIEPGVVVMCYGYQTGEWAVANAAIKKVYESQYLFGKSSIL